MEAVVPGIGRRLWRIIRFELFGAAFFFAGCAWGGLLASTIGPLLFRSLSHVV